MTLIIAKERERGVFVNDWKGKGGMGANKTRARGTSQKGGHRI